MAASKLSAQPLNSGNAKARTSENAKGLAEWGGFFIARNTNEWDKQNTDVGNQSTIPILNCRSPIPKSLVNSKGSKKRIFERGHTTGATETTPSLRRLEEGGLEEGGLEEGGLEEGGLAFAEQLADRLIVMNPLDRFGQQWRDAQLD
ncbi:hypothetical protein Poly41_38240 [Novipirellula artificiosorum]|uniref:Uncharacterized protein n=1 Tax=Novipirellula artificiosorum TaxID=2528016 RepID=A0A5C6DKB6_9BACT|nr:hypothetical protein Poly41_38240 [Novipirellula artificiosorum]